MTRRGIVACLLLGLLGMASGEARQQRRPTAEPPPEPQTAPAPETDAQAPGVRSGETVEVADGQVPVFRSGINYVRVDAFVTDGDDNPVFDLTQDDFEVYEDGVLQDVDSFDVVRVDPLPTLADEPLTRIGFRRSDQERAASRPDVRVFVIFLDDYHVRFGNGIRARRMIVEFLENDLIPTDLVGVMYPLTPLDAVVLTRNHEAVINAVNRFEGVKFDCEPRNEFEARYSFYPLPVIERIRNDVSLSALRGLMIYLGGLREGRKSVLLVSEGYSNYLPPNIQCDHAGRRGAFAPEPGSPAAAFDETRAFFENSGLMMDLRYVFRTATRFNTSIYPVDPRGLAVFEFDLDQGAVGLRTDQRQLRMTVNTLRTLAEQTGGRAIVNQNDLRPGLRQMLEDASGYYLLGYDSSGEPADGKFHEIEVRLKREGLRVRARPGYWAVTERDVERSLTTRANEVPKAVDAALGELAAPRRGRLVRTWLGTSRAENGRTRVTFVWEPVEVTGRREAASRVLVTALGDTGGAYFRGRVPDEATAGRGTVRSRRQANAPPPVMRVEFEADPGTMQISLAIEGEAGEVLDRDRDRIVIPDFTGPDVVLSTPSFVRARNAHEFRALVDDWTATPTAAREFRRTELLLLRFEAYGPGDVAPEIEAQLVNRGGETIFPLDVTPADRPEGFQVSLAPANLPPGEYLIELRATLPASEATRLVAFRLGG